MYDGQKLPSVAALISELGPPTPESTAYRRELEALYEKYPDPDTFYTTLKLPPQIRIVWTANTKNVLNWNPDSHESFRERIHPFYSAFHLTFAHSAYRCCSHLGSAFSNRHSYYAIYLPLMRGDGRYYWMRQISLVAEIDAEGRIVSFFNMYRLLEPYGTLQPSRPKVVLNHEIRPELERRISKLTEADILEKFENRLKEPHLKTFRAYRAQYQGNTIAPPTSQSVAAAMDRRVSTVHTYNKFILEAARETFPAAQFNSVQELLEFFHIIFGDGQSSEH